MEEERERTSMDHDLDTPEDPLLRREETAAAAEAGSIGGARPDYEGDEAERPLVEGGEGEAEGFEVAERDLTESASHGDNRYSPEGDGFSPEEAPGRGGAVYGEPDEVDPTEVVRDPREGGDDPGAGPGIAPDR
jgi:hypothetical protein